MPRRRLICALLAAAWGAAAPAAVADCGGPVRAAAHGRHATRPPVALGDSTMIYAVPWLARHGIDADAQGCRQFPAGARMLAARARARTLPALSIMALGANGPVTGAMVDRVLRTLGPRRMLALVTPRRSTGSAAALRRAAARHRRRALLIDWARFSAHRPWFAPDGLHVTPDGGRIYARFIARAVAPLADPPVRALHPPRHSLAARDCGTVTQLGRRLGVKIVRGAVSCARARALARRSPVERVAGWRGYYWKATGRGPWIDLYRAVRGGALVGTVADR